MPELRALRVFATVARRGGFTGAAQELFVAQQAVSRTVAGLERELGVRLFERTTRSVRLTDAGRALLDDAERILADVEAAVDRARAAGTTRQGLIRIGITPAITDEEVSWLADAIRAHAPAVAVALSDVRPGVITTQLQNGALDVVVARTLAWQRAIAVRRIGTVPAALAVPGAHPLARCATIDPSRLRGQRLICWSRPGSRYTRLLLRLARAGAADLDPVVSSVTGRDGLADVAAGRGVALVAASRRPRRGVVLVPIVPTLPLPISAAWHRTTDRAVVRVFLAAVTRAGGGVVVPAASTRQAVPWPAVR